MADHRVILHKIISDTMEDQDFFADFKDEYAKRVIAQKMLFLLESKFGVRTPWAFNWYVAGPYAPGLTSELYAIAEHPQDVKAAARDVRLKPSAATKIAGLKNLLSRAPRQDTQGKAEWLELLASIHYIAEKEHLDLESQAEKVIRQVEEAKPKFSGRVAPGVRALLSV
jgi:uncharacterized protein YwgA